MKPELDEQPLAAFKPRQTMPAPVDEVVADADIDPPRRSWRFLKLVLGCLAIALSVEAGLSIYAAWQASWWQGLLWSIGLGGVVLFAVAILVREWWLLRGLRRREVQQRQLAQSPQQFDADQLLAQLQRDDLSALWYQQRQHYQHLQPVEQLQRFEEDVLGVVDQQVQRLIFSQAGTTALLVAASPNAILDMVVVLWRSQRLLSQIAKVYGIKLGYMSRIRMWQQVFRAMLFAGVTELAADVGTSALGAELAGKLSARAGQGLALGLLSARIGVQAQRQCRPLPFKHIPAPSVWQLKRQLGEQLLRQLTRAKTTTKVEK